MRILCGIVTFDRDADMASLLYISIKEYQNETCDILILTRQSDKKTREFWEKKALEIILVEDYNIPKEKRHHWEELAKKRKIVLDYGQKNNYDYIWFVDSDILPTPNVLSELLKSQKDICVAPYKPTWSEKPCVGIYSEEFPYVQLHFIEKKEGGSRDCLIAGFGCTLLKNTVFGIPVEYKFFKKGDFIIEGEDIGFFTNAFNAKKTCEYLGNYIQPHFWDRFS